MTRATSATSGTDLRGWLAWGAAAFFYAYGFFQRVAPAVVSRELLVDLAGDATRLGLLSAAYFYAYAAVQIPGGLLLDRLGTRRLLTAAALASSLGGTLFALAPTLPAAVLGRALVGLGVGVAYIGSLKIASLWLPPARFGLVAGLTLTAGTLGAVTAQAPLGLLVDALGNWRPAMGLVAGVGLLVALLLGLLLRPSRLERTTPHGTALGQRLRALLIRRDLWLLALVTACGGAPILTFAGLWGVPWLVETRGLDRTTAGAVTSLVLLAWAVGGPLLGSLSDRLGRRPVLAGGLALAALAFGLAVLARPPLSLLLAALALTGLAAGAMVAAFALARDLAGREQAGLALGFVNTGVLLLGALMQTAVGAVLDLTAGDGPLTGSWSVAWLVPIGAFVLGALGALALPTRSTAPRV